MEDKSKYNQRGVSADKTEVHQAIKNLDKGLYPTAFCKILPDIVAGDDNYANIMHADTAGTKTALAYLYWKATGNVKIWENIMQDAIVMNIDDMACVGITDNIILSSTIGRNKHLITGEVISTIINGAFQFCEKLKPYGINIHLSGGETADVGDIVRTIDVGYTTFARWPKNKLIVNNIKAGNVIVGLASFGQATYENVYNSGLGSNGLTSARHDVLSKYYEKNYPEVVDPNTPEAVRFSGSKKLTDSYNGYIIGDLLTAPTRTYLPILKKVFEKIDPSQINGLINCTGGGQTKVMHFAKNVRIIKDNLFKTPPVFNLIKEEAGTNDKELYKVFNMGHRLEFYVNPSIASAIINVANQFNVEAQIIGEVVNSENTELNIINNGHNFIYQK